MHKHVQPVSDCVYTILPENDSKSNFANDFGGVDLRNSSPTAETSGPSSARERWRRGAAKAMLVSALNQPDVRSSAEAQGIDLRRQSWGHLSHKLNTCGGITVVDYCASQAKLYSPLSNEALPLFLSLPRPAWSKVRWINVDGMSWDCISALARHFDLHPLAVEDAIHVPQRVKVDFYGSTLIYCSLTLSSLTSVSQQGAVGNEADDEAGGVHNTEHTLHSRVGSIKDQQGREEVPGLGDGSYVLSSARTVSSNSMPHVFEGDSQRSMRSMNGTSTVPQQSLVSDTVAEAMRLRKQINELAIERLHSNRSCDEPTSHWQKCSREQVPLRPLRKRTAARMATRMAHRSPQNDPHSSASISTEISAEQVSLFLTRDGTLISIFERNGSRVTRRVLHQVLEENTLVRDCQDPSYLLNLLMDAIVDVTYPIVEAFNSQLHAFEDSVLLGRAEASLTKVLFVMQGDLATLRRTVLPLSAMVTALQAHCDVEGAPAYTPLISNLTRTYLGDVKDHVCTTIEDIDGLQQQCGALSVLVFNILAHKQNRSMQMLSTMSSIFLPLSFLAGVYGMNFDKLPEVHWEYGYPYFWAMCLLLVSIFFIGLWKGGLLH
ncbi:hypothetical protein CEUSTIGMA_g10188.t1 [Chlamydomonas eustigma]|uniref:Magnesium transporter n=1 Tax=Chlamydomonas eustigma TaxID=1157962 RepID=A0A250XIM9_9CHLO|nr:hypothetical protein CEUSTIGMA_g10188.t1 [Chlamydomonas eustigma]|eukprot:GAX82762.1 hypothetical protein CEUSTIGMA_g10188.t1 [Chlamydomonas eustigma]